MEGTGLFGLQTGQLYRRGLSQIKQYPSSVGIGGWEKREDVPFLHLNAGNADLTLVARTSYCFRDGRAVNQLSYRALPEELARNCWDHVVMFNLLPDGFTRRRTLSADSWAVTEASSNRTHPVIVLSENEEQTQAFAFRAAT
jgi:hypothetical protein